MAQATSGYATSGNQYNSTNSYFLIDSVPGSGDSIPGPVTISATAPAVALTVAGNEIVTGQLGVTSTLTASNGVLTNTIGPTVLGGTLTVGYGANDTLLQSNESVLVTAGSTFPAVVRSIAGPVQVKGRTAQMTNNNDEGLYVASGPEDTLGYVSYFPEKVNLQHGLALAPTMGTYAAPAAATLGAPGAYTFNMTGNKAFVTTGGGAFTLIVTLPLNGLGLTCNWTAMITGLGATPTNVSTFIQSGVSLILSNAGITTPITVGITLF